MRLLKQCFRKESYPSSIYPIATVQHGHTLNYPQEHALEVLCLPGVPSGTRYTALTSSNPSPYLITYEFPNLSYITSPDFQVVMNRELPQSLIDRIYAHTSFDIRFYSEIAPPAELTKDKSTSTLASITFSPSPAKDSDFKIWFAGKFVLDLRTSKDFVRVRRFEFVNGVVMERNAVNVEEKPKFLALLEIENSGEDGRGEFQDVFESQGLADVQVEWYEVKKEWKEGEVKKAGEAP